MKYGINTEDHAKAKYKTLFKKSHSKSSFKDPSMTIMESHPFISASLDLGAQSHCHGPTLVNVLHQSLDRYLFLKIMII